MIGQQCGDPQSDPCYFLLSPHCTLCPQVLAEIENNDTLDKFRDDYKKVYAGYAKSRENERRLMMRCRDLKSEIVANGSKLAEVMRTSKEEKSSIVALKKVCKVLSPSRSLSPSLFLSLCISLCLSVSLSLCQEVE